MFRSMKVHIVSQGICDKSKRKSFSEKFLKIRTSFTEQTHFRVIEE